MGTLKCGFARKVITPPYDIPLDGMGGNTGRVPNNVTEDITASFIALSDGTDTALICTMDVLWIHRFFYEKAAKLISDKTGVPEKNIFLSATHTHAAPDMRTVSDERVSKYLDFLYRILPETAVEAVSDMSESRVYAGRCYAKGLNSVRRYFMENGKLNSVGVKDDSPIVITESEGDHTLQAVRFRRDGKKDVVLANFAAHPSCGSDLKAMHPSYIGAFRRKAEESGKFLLAFFQGAQGNMEGFSKVRNENSDARDENYVSLGERLSECLSELLPKLRETGTGSLTSIQRFMEAEVDHSRDYLLTAAQTLLSYSGNVTLPAEITEKYDLHTSTDTRKVITNATTYKDTAALNVPVGVLSFGEIAFVFAGYEMFTQSGMQIKSASPFSMTFICGNSCGSYGYVPAEECFGNFGFEVNSTTFVRGTAEKLADGIIGMLYESEK